MTSAEPALFREAVAAMNAVTVRPEIELGPIRPPQRLAPYSYALGAEIKHPELDVIPERSEGDAFGRLIMLYDPDGSDAWDGTIRLVAYVQADLDSSEAVDPLLPEVAWSWLVDALTARTDQVRALGGTEPALFREAVAAMNAVTVRPEIELGPIRPPQRLAPYSYALGAEIKHPELDVIPERSEGDAFGRLIMLYDPDGSDAWDGTIRLVAYVQADLDSSEAVDPLLPEVAWSWLVDALTARTDQVRALGGTVTATTSVRYGDISGPPRAHQLELRASWTATTPDLGAHVQAFCDVLEHAAGLPPAGVTDLGSRSRA